MQAQAWPAIATGSHTLISAPTGSGKTLAAFLWGIDRLAADPLPDDDRHTRLVYVSPLKALSYDIERNLRAPLRGIGADIEVAIRTGDTPQRERQAMRRRPPDILITTPESLYLILTSQARDMLERVQWAIVDEIHAIASTKRGSHTALTLERMAQLNEYQRIGLSATQNPLEEVGRFMVGPRRTCTIVDAGVRKPLDLKIQVPVESMVEPEQSTGHLDPLDPVAGGEATRRSIWPAIYPQVLELVRQHRSTIVFVNNRRMAERLALRLNELANADRADDDEPFEEIARAHHGSLAREERTVVEELLKAGDLPCLVATSSLELGIDMGAVDLVLQIESPKSVARGLQRIGRAGHSVGRHLEGPHLPQVPRRPPRVRGRRQAHARGPHRADRRAAQRARRPRPADRRDRGLVGGRADRCRRAARARHAHALLRRAQPRAAGERPGHARRPLPVGRVRRAAAAHRVGPGRRDDPSPQGRAPARGDERGHDPRPRPVRRDAARRQARRRARRGDGLRGAARADVPARRVVVADRGDRPRPGHRHPRARRAGRRPLLARRLGRPPEGARRGDRRVQPLGRRPGRRDARARARPRRARGAEPPRLPARAAGRDARPAERHDGRHRALPRRDRRLAPLRPHAVRRPRPRRMVAGAVGADPRRARPRGRRHLVGRRHHRPPPRRRRAARRRPRAHRPGRARGPRRRRAGLQRAVRRALPRERRAARC